MGLQDKLGRAPTPAEMARAMNVPKCKLDLIHRTMAATRAVSTGHATGSEGPTPVDLHPDDPTAEAAHLAERRDDYDKVRTLLMEMDVLDAQVVCLRFGLDGGLPRTLKETGRSVGLTRERVRQIEQRALTLIRNAFEDRRLAG
jgi:DNA-directed RNA polymerase sigma subunit (sigma70/sigma32)